MSETITRTINGIETEIEFDYFPAERGDREKGIQMTPDYPEEIEIIDVSPASDCLEVEGIVREYVEWRIMR